MYLQSQEDQELSAGEVARQLILNIFGEDQTMDHTDMIVGNDHDTIFVDFAEYAGQEDTNFENTMGGLGGHCGAIEDEVLLEKRDRTGSTHFPSFATKVGEKRKTKRGYNLYFF